MSSLPNEIFSDITNFLPNDDITDLMLTSKKFNVLVTPRLQKINEDLTTMNQSIGSPVPEVNDVEFLAQMNLKRFEPIGSVAKKRIKDVFKSYRNRELTLEVMALKGKLSLERFDDATFLRILWALVANSKFCEEYNISQNLVGIIKMGCTLRLQELVLQVRYGRNHPLIKHYVLQRRYF